MEDTGLRVREDGSYYVDFEVFLKRPEVRKHYIKPKIKDSGLRPMARGGFYVDLKVFLNREDIKTYILADDK